MRHTGMTYSIVGTTEAMNFRKSTRYLQAACSLMKYRMKYQHQSGTLKYKSQL